MKQIESELEKACVKFARSNGWDCWKNEKNGNKGIPDYSLLKSGVFLLVEFKTESGKVSHEHIYWDQASVLAQIGLLNPAGLPVADATSALRLKPI